MTSQTTPARILGLILARWWVLVLAAIIGGGAAFAYSSTQPALYQSSASTYFSMRSATSGSDINQGSTYAQNQMLSFAELATSALVLDKVREELDLDLSDTKITQMTTLTIPQNTVILEVRAASTDPKFSAELANSIAKNLASTVESVAPKDEAGNTTIAARVIDPATAPEFQFSPNKQRDALLGAFAGGLLAALIVALWGLLDTRVRNAEVVRRVTDVPVIGAIPQNKDRGRRPVVVTNSNGPSAEAYRGVRSSLRFAAIERPVTAIGVTSSIPGEGKTTTAVNIALTYAEAGVKVLLVDADFRRPMVAEILGLDNTVGLTSMLVDSLDFDSAKLTWGDSRLMVLPAGEVPPNPAELLASARMAEVMTELRKHVDVIVIDTAPMLAVADATVIAPLLDTMLVVADSSRVRSAQLERAVESLKAVGTQIAGIVLTRVKKTRNSTYHYYSEPTPRLRRRRERGSSAPTEDAAQ